MASPSKRNRDGPPPLKRYMNKRLMQDFHDRNHEETVKRIELIRAIGALIKERAPKAYENLTFYFERGDDPGMSISMDWETLAAILLISLDEDEHDTGDFQPAK